MTGRERSGRCATARLRMVQRGKGMVPIARIGVTAVGRDIELDCCIGRGGKQ